MTYVITSKHNGALQFGVCSYVADVGDFEVP